MYCCLPFWTPTRQRKSLSMKLMKVRLFDGKDTTIVTLVPGTFLLSVQLMFDHQTARQEDINWDALEDDSLQRNDVLLLEKKLLLMKLLKASWMDFFVGEDTTCHRSCQVTFLRVVQLTWSSNRIAGVYWDALGDDFYIYQSTLLAEEVPLLGYCFTFSSVPNMKKSQWGAP